MATVAKERVVFQFMNHSREEMFYVTTDIPIEEMILKIAKDRKGPAKDWEKGDAVNWRPLTDLLPAEQAHAMAVELSGTKPPNNYEIIQWLPDELPEE